MDQTQYLMLHTICCHLYLQTGAAGVSAWLMRVFADDITEEFAYHVMRIAVEAPGGNVSPTYLSSLVSKMDAWSADLSKGKKALYLSTKMCVSNAICGEALKSTVTYASLIATNFGLESNYVFESIGQGQHWKSPVQESFFIQ